MCWCECRDCSWVVEESRNLYYCTKYHMYEPERGSCPYGEPGCPSFGPLDRDYPMYNHSEDAYRHSREEKPDNKDTPPQYGTNTWRKLPAWFLELFEKEFKKHFSSPTDL